MPKVPEGKLSRKQAKFVKGVAEGKPAYVAALEAYDTTNASVAATIASENMNKPNVKDAIEAEMVKQGITMDKIIAPVAKALRATHVAKVDGEPVDTGLPDLEMQLKGHDRAVKLMTFGIKKDDDTPQRNQFIQVNNNYVDRYKD